MSENLKRRVSASLLWSFAHLWGVRVVGFVQLVVITRLLSPEDVGMISFAIAIIAMIESLIDLGFMEALQQAKDVNDEQLRSAFTSVLLVAIALVVIIAAGSPYIAAASGRPYLGYLLPALSLTIPLNASLAVPNALLSRSFRYDVIAFRSVASCIVGAAVGIAAALMGFTYWSIALRILVEALLGCVLTWRVSPWRPSLGFSRSEWLGLFATSRFMLGMRALNLVNTRMDALILGVRVAPAELGIYTTGQRAHGVLMDSLFGAVNQVTLPAFARIRGDSQRAARVLTQVAKLASYATFPVFALCAALSDDLTVLIYGETWRASGPILQVLCVGGWLFSVSFFNATMLTAMGYANITLGLVALNAVTNAVAFLYGSQAGALGVAIAYVVRGYLVYPVNLWFVRKAIGLSPTGYLRALAPTAVCSLIAALAALLVREVTALEGLAARLVLAAGVGTLLYALLCFVLFKRHTLQTLSELSAIHPAFDRLRGWFGAPAADRA